MWIPLLFLVLLLAVAMVQSMHGWFSAMIMMVLSVCCASLAFGTYDWVAVHWVAPYWRPNYAHAIALASLFGVPLITVKLVTDKLIRRSCLIPGMLDRIGGGLCGLITALIVTGVCGYAVANVPFGPSIMGFERVPVADRHQKKGGPPPKLPAEDATEKGLWLNPDRFTARLASVMSAGVFSGDYLLSEDDPDPVQSAAWLNSANGEVSRIAPPHSISIVRTEPLEFIYDWKPGLKRRRGDIPEKYDPITAKPGYEFRMIRVALGDQARDARHSHVFTLRQFRLIGELGAGGPLTQFHAIAIQEADATKPTNRHLRRDYWRGEYWPVTDTLYSPRDDNDNQVEIVFEIPDNFNPVFLEYKHGARVAVSFSQDTDTADNDSSTPEPVAKDTSRKIAKVTHSPSKKTAQQTASSTDRQSRRTRRNRNNTVPTSGRGGNIRGETAKADQSFFGNELPIPLTDYRNVRDVERKGNKLLSGHLLADLSKQSDKTARRPLTAFEVPSSRRLLQLNTTRLNVRSGLGRSIDFAKQTLQNFWVEDDAGHRYKIIGKYALANVRSKRMMELEYYPNQAGSIGGLGKFRTIKDANLKRDYQLVLLFLVDPGARITSFSTGGDATRRDDLSGEDLVAPH